MVRNKYQGKGLLRYMTQPAGMPALPVHAKDFEEPVQAEFSIAHEAFWWSVPFVAGVNTKAAKAGTDPALPGCILQYPVFTARRGQSLVSLMP